MCYFFFFQKDLTDGTISPVLSVLSSSKSNHNVLKERHTNKAKCSQKPRVLRKWKQKLIKNFVQILVRQNIKLRQVKKNKHENKRAAKEDKEQHNVVTENEKDTRNSNDEKNKRKMKKNQEKSKRKSDPEYDSDKFDRLTDRQDMTDFIQIIDGEKVCIYFLICRIFFIEYFLIYIIDMQYIF